MRCNSRGAQDQYNLHHCFACSLEAISPKDWQTWMSVVAHGEAKPRI